MDCNYTIYEYKIEILQEILFFVIIHLKILIIALDKRINLLLTHEFILRELLIMELFTYIKMEFYFNQIHLLLLYQQQAGVYVT